jgi:hypothetical protein
MLAGGAICGDLADLPGANLEIGGPGKALIIQLRAAAALSKLRAHGGMPNKVSPSEGLYVTLWRVRHDQLSHQAPRAKAGKHRLSTWLLQLTGM